jgi:hypothetical protein
LLSVGTISKQGLKETVDQPIANQLPKSKAAVVAPDHDRLGAFLMHMILLLGHNELVEYE